MSEGPFEQGEPPFEPSESFLPLEDEPPSAREQAELADEEILAGLTDPDLDELPLEQEEKEPIGRSWAFDFAREGFVYGHEVGSSATGKHGPLQTYGVATLRTWIEKCLHTARGAHPVHPEDYGLEPLDDIIGGPVLGAPAADIEARVREALTFHPRIDDVTDFRAVIDPDNEYVAVSFSVLIDDEAALSFQGVRLP